MIKLTFCLMRLPNLTREQFQDYWLNKHAPLVASHRAALRIARYVQLHSADPAVSADLRASRGGPKQYDGVAQLWWRSWDDLGAALESPEGRAAGAVLLEDEQRFIDLLRSPLWFGEDKVIFD
ncbi:MAG: EthD family reductase [Alphaproteobacteria bacterium]|nr:EthD family reductase [Alphaproteobacteria bacterium]